MTKKIKKIKLLKIIEQIFENEVEIFNDFKEFYKYGVIKDLDKELDNTNYKYHKI